MIDFKIKVEDHPTYVAWHICPTTGKWTSIGAAWPHMDARGFLLQLTKMQGEGTIVLRDVPINLN